VIGTMYVFFCRLILFTFTDLISSYRF
jgi:hypothetical protein